MRVLNSYILHLKRSIWFFTTFANLMENDTIKKGKALEIIYQDDYLVAVNKPHGMLVHRTKIALDADELALQILRDQIGAYLFPVHRLDRKTSGVLIFALDRATARLLQKQIMEHSIQKIYRAIVRGFFPSGVISVDYALTNDRGKTQEALTRFELLDKVEIDLPFGQHNTSRYSLIEARPKTGRMHQIRKHLNHLRYPIIGDRPHGCNKQNKLFKEKWGMTTMMLHACEWIGEHPISKEPLHLKADLSSEFLRVKKILGFR